MPDDEKTEVTEQIDDNPKDEAAEFSSETEADELEDTGFEGLDKSEETDKTDATDAAKKAADEADKAESDKAEPDDKKDETDKSDEADEEEEPGEDDEDVTRGKEILEAEEKAEADKKAASEAEKVQKEEDGAYSPFTESWGDEQIKFFSGVIPPNLFPDTALMRDKDGNVVKDAEGNDVSLDFKGVFENEPELPLMIVGIANNIIRQLIANGYLATTHDVAGVNESIDNRLFLRTLTNKTDGVPKAQEIYRDESFKKWMGEQPKEIQALMKSPDPYDHIRVFKRYLNSEKIAEAKDKVVKLDDKRKKSKETFDAVHKSTVKSKGKPGKSSLTPRDEEMEGFTSKDDDDDIPG